MPKCHSLINRKLMATTPLSLSGPSILNQLVTSLANRIQRAENSPNKTKRSSKPKSKQTKRHSLNRQSIKTTSQQRHQPKLKLRRPDSRCNSRLPSRLVYPNQPRTLPLPKTCSPSKAVQMAKVRVVGTKVATSRSASRMTQRSKRVSA